jgi:succinyl-CoA synthetase beta subunit
MGARRWLNIHEADSYEVLNANGVKTPRAKVAYTATEAKTVAAELGTSKYVVKAQVLAGGRGKGHFENGFQGGVHIVDSLNEVADVASKMIGHKLITKQTGEEGRPCNKIMVAEPVDITHEYYLALLLDRKAGNIAMIGSREGGMNIEETAAKNPDAIKKVAINIAAGMSEADAQSMSDALGFQGSLAVQAKDQFLKLYETMINCDATQIEINPMVTTSDHRLLCADAKLNFDDNAEFRQTELFKRRDTTQENPLDVEAQQYDLNYIGLSGNIGCLVNGAGLAMATMDMLHHEGGQAANFLDVGGSANTKTITAAFGIITTDPKVKAIFVNIFGGIMSCKTIAEGMVGALANVEVKIPIVVRLMGTHMEEGAAVLASYKGSTPVIPCIDFDEAARKAVELASK